MGMKAFVELQQSVADIPEGQVHKLTGLCKEQDRPALLEMVEEARQAVMTLMAMAQEQDGAEAVEGAQHEAPSSSALAQVRIHAA